jgi:hypothetical protein
VRKPVRKKFFGLTLGALLFALSSSAQAQQTGKIFRIGFLDASTASANAVLLDAFRQELKKLGWIEGKNIAIEYRFAEQSLSACLSWRRTWFVLRLILSWCRGLPWR